MAKETNGISNGNINTIKINENELEDDEEIIRKIQTLIPGVKQSFIIYSQQFREFLVYAERLEKLLTNVGTVYIEKKKLEDELKEIKAEQDDVNKQLEINADSPVYLNVGGQTFATTIKRLIDTNSSFFKTLIQDKWDQTTNTSATPIFIDRDGRLFDYILKYLRTGELNIEDKTIRRELLIEAKYYKLSNLENELNTIGKKDDVVTIENTFDYPISPTPKSPGGAIPRTRSSPIASNLSITARSWSPNSIPSVSLKTKLHPADTLLSWRSNTMNENRLNIFIGSVLLTNEYETKLVEFLDSNISSYQQTWRLIYRATEHGFEASNFHHCCDNYSPTISIIQTDYGNIFGGYTAVSWSSANTRADQCDRTAFLFTLKNNVNVPPTKFPIADEFQQFAISHNPTCGPNFGSPNNEGSDLCLRGKFNEKTNCIFFPKSYIDTTNQGALIFAKKYFACKEIEVFTLIKDD